MKSKKVVLSIVLLFSFSSCYTQISTMAEAINKAGRQRMLTQRIAKDYMIIGLGSNKICIKSAQKNK